MKIILSGGIKDLFKNKIFNPKWYQALGAGWELGKGMSQKDTFRSKKLRMLNQFLQKNPDYAAKYYGHSGHGGIGFNRIQQYLQMVDWQAAQSHGYTTREAIQYILEQKGGLRHLQQLGILPVQQRKTKRPSQSKQTTQPKQTTPPDVIPDDMVFEDDMVSEDDLW